jgi:predicted nucleic acid-binding protein
VPRTPLLLDACIAINLAATGHMQHIAEVTGFTFALARQAAAEVGYLRDLADGVLARTAVDLSQETGDTLQIIDLTSPEYQVYIRLAREVDDGEAASIAIAAQRGLRFATDDRKARRLCAELQVPDPLRTVALMRSYADVASLSQAQLRDLLIKIRDRASFQPPRGDPDHKWWEDCIEVI